MVNTFVGLLFSQQSSTVDTQRRQITNSSIRTGHIANSLNQFVPFSLRMMQNLHSSLVSDASICGIPGQDSMDISTNSLEEEAQGASSGGDKMDIDVTPENVQTFRQNSLALVTYPWTSGVIMQSDWSKFFDQEHFAFVSFVTHAIYESNSRVL
jgi:hypothetical protein